MTRKYNPGLYVGLVNEWQAEEPKAIATADAIPMVRKRHGKVDILLPLKRGWKDILRQEARARVAFIRTFYPEATGADLTRARFYQSLLTGVAGGLATVTVYALSIICFA